MNRKFSPSAEKALNLALTYAKEFGHTYIGSEHLLLGILSDPECAGAKILAGRLVTFLTVRSAIHENTGRGEESDLSPSDMTPRLRRIIESSAKEALDSGQNFIGTEHLLSSLLGEPDSMGAKIISLQGVSLAEMKSEVLSFSRKKEAPQKPKEKKNPQFLLQYGRDLTDKSILSSFDPLIGRETEVSRVIEILSRRMKNNPCLIGDPGVGKTAIVEGLAMRISSGEVPDDLLGKSIIKLDISSMLAGSKYRGEFEDRMKNVLDEVRKDPDTILFIDEIHTIMGAGAAEGAIDAANIIKPSLSRGEIRIIGATTTEEYRRYIEKDAALERRFQSVFVKEPSLEETINILKGLREKYESHHKVIITDDAINAAVKLSVRYLNDRFLPDKAIDLIDETCARLRLYSSSKTEKARMIENELRTLSNEKEEAVRSQDFEKAASLRACEIEKEKLLEEEKKLIGEKNGLIMLSPSDIEKSVSIMTGIPVNYSDDSDVSDLYTLEEKLGKEIIGQDEAISELSRAIRRGRVGLKDSRRPVGSFLFLGSSGVGKTELSKALSRILFKKDDSLIRLDMSEYMEKHSISKLIGAPPGYIGYDDAGKLTERVRRHPYSVVLFDEIEKAHPDVLNILLQIMEDGRLTDSQGRTVDFSSTVIILTSNVGTKDLEEAKPLGFSSTDGKADREKIIKSSLYKSFRPEFINRIDEIIVFRKLEKADLERICEKLLEESAKRAGNIGITLSFDRNIPEFIVSSISENDGARPLRRNISKLIEDELASEIIENRISANDSIKVKASDGHIVFEREKAGQNKKTL